MDFSRPGIPTDNGTVELLNGRQHQECLNESWFMLLEETRGKIEAWSYTITRCVPILRRDG
ncbi:integrase core domain-containing protein [Kosakonia sp. MUSA4]|uniref:integrase core domain-containing protein n=1 Tax=Kosakonia sp. MUSA4 TaxID=2067958 RepID=UPI0035302E19